ncbi:MAG: cysteine dioxygenase family protein [Rhodospirillaceae bacterium]
MNAADLVEKFSAAAAGAEPYKAVVALMKELKSGIAGVAAATDYLEGVGGNALQAFYRAPNLSLLKVRFVRGRRTPPHNHGTWAAILQLTGCERNFVYKRNTDGSLTYERTVDMEPGDIIYMPDDAVHVVECFGDTDATGLHVYGANVLGVTRSMWDPETVAEHPLDWSVYESFAQRAMALGRAPLT